MSIDQRFNINRLPLRWFSLAEAQPGSLLPDSCWLSLSQAELASG